MVLSDLVFSFQTQPALVGKDELTTGDYIAMFLVYGFTIYMIVRIVYEFIHIFFLPRTTKFNLFASGRKYTIVSKFGKSLSKRVIKTEGHNYLNQVFPYYTNLSANDQKKFLKRLYVFANTKRFLTRGEGFELDRPMVFLISATAIQLTFGLPDIYLSNFKTIVLYRDQYYSEITKKYHYGEANPMRGILVLSWLPFLKGLHNETDGINLGLHEMAHGLHLENRIHNDEFDFLPAKELAAWDQLVENRIEQYHTNGQGCLRAYAYTNPYEFFAVSVEYFFERADYLNKQDPQLLGLLTVLLNQQPNLNVSSI